MSLADRTPPSIEEFATYTERFCNWRRWGGDDQLGTLNFITNETRIAAATLVQEGRSVSCAHPIATDRVVSGARNRSPAEHRLDVGDFGCADYIGVAYHGYVNTHIDALCHIYTADRRLYNDRPASEVTAEGARTNSVEHWRDGIITRGVLYDVPRHRGEPHVTFDEPVHGWELEDIARAQGITPRPGDAVLVRMGAAAFWATEHDLDPPWAAPGLHASALDFLYEHDAALLAWDLMEAPGQPYDGPSHPIHSIAIPYMGMPLLDNANLESLSETCSELSRWEFQFVVAPLIIIGGTGSPANPIAIF